MLDFLEASKVSTVALLVIPNMTYKRLENSSNELITEFDRAIVTHMLVKAWLRQNELGIKAGFPFLTWKCIHATNRGKANKLRHKRTILPASLIR